MPVNHYTLMTCMDILFDELATIIPAPISPRSIRHGPISTGHWEAGYQVLYRPMAGEGSFSPSWCRLLVVPSDELNGKAESTKLLSDMAERIRDLEAEVERQQQRAQAAETRLALARQTLRKLRR